MTKIEDTGLFGLLLEDLPPCNYQITFTFAEGTSWTTFDPYVFSPSLGELDLHLISEGRHQRLYDHLGAHFVKREGLDGVTFALWAPTAERGQRSWRFQPMERSCVTLCAHWEAPVSGKFSSPNSAPEPSTSMKSALKMVICA